MDADDFRILGHLMRDARKPFESIGRAVGLSGNAVKARVARMQEDGLLRGFVATPDPALFGYKMAFLIFQTVEDLEAREQEILDHAPEIGAVRWVDVTLDKSVLIVAFYKDGPDYDRLERAASNLVGRPPTFACRCSPPDAPLGAELPALSLLDWKIVRALRSDGRKTLKDVVDETGASFKTVKKRLDRLLTTEAVSIHPSISTSEASGLVLFDLLVLLDDAKRRPEVLKLLPKDAVAIPIEHPAPGLVIHNYRPNLREAQEDHRRVKNAPGVAQAYFKIATRHAFDGWLDARIDQAIRDLERARRERATPPAAAAAVGEERQRAENPATGAI